MNDTQHTETTTATGRRPGRRIRHLAVAAALAGGLFVVGQGAGADSHGPGTTDCEVSGPGSADALERAAEECEANDPCIALGPGSADGLTRWTEDCRARR